MIPSSIRPQRGPFKPAPHAAALLPALARARSAPSISTCPAALRTRGQCAHGLNAHGTRAHAASTHAAPARTRGQRTRHRHTRGANAHGLNAHGANAHTVPARTRCQRTRHRHTRCQRTNRPRPHAILSHQDPYARTLSARKRPSPPSEVIIKRLGNEGYERLEDMNDCFFWTQILLSSPQVNGITKTEDMNDSFISSASAREIVHNFWPFTTSGRSYPPAVHTLQPFISSQ